MANKIVNIGTYKLEEIYQSDKQDTIEALERIYELIDSAPTMDKMEFMKPIRYMLVEALHSTNIYNEKGGNILEI